jgi:hypothetical protein
VLSQTIVYNKKVSTKYDYLGDTMNKKEVYEAPIVEVIQFELEDSIALSGNDGSGSFGNEENWG